MHRSRRVRDGSPPSSMRHRYALRCVVDTRFDASRRVLGSVSRTCRYSRRRPRDSGRYIYNVGDTSAIHRAGRAAHGGRRFGPRSGPWCPYRSSRYSIRGSWCPFGWWVPRRQSRLIYRGVAGGLTPAPIRRAAIQVSPFGGLTRPRAPRRRPPRPPRRRTAASPPPPNHRRRARRRSPRPSRPPERSPHRGP